MRGLLSICRLLLTTVLLGTAACGSETGQSTLGCGTAYVEWMEEGILHRIYDGTRLPAADPYQPTLATIYGADQGPDTYFMGRFRSGQVARLADGTVFAFDRDEQTVHVFAPDGSHRGSFGREGQGPGEFRRAAGMAALDGELYLFDGQNMRISVFNLSGGLLRETRLDPALANPRAMPSLLLPWSDAAARRYVAVSRVIFEVPNQSAEFRMMAYLLDEEGRRTETIADTVLTIPRIYEAGRTWASPFERYATVAVAPSCPISISYGNDFTFHLSSPGDPRYPLEVVVQRTARPVTRELREAVFQRYASSGREAEARRHVPIPQNLPQVDNMMWDAAHRLWVRDYVPRDLEPELVTYNVFSSNGLWQFTQSLPLKPIQLIGSDGVLFESEGEDGAPLLEWWAFTRP